VIKQISIRGHKSFPSDQPHLIPMDVSKRVALFYGSNGAGKSAISEVLHRNGNNDGPIPNCSVTATGGQFQYLVYNEAFVDSCFRNPAGLPGIFSIGKTSAEALQKIDELEGNLRVLEEKKTKCLSDQQLLKSEQEKRTELAAEATWRVYKDHAAGDLGSHVSGYGKNRKGLFETLRAIQLAPNDVIVDVAQLSARMRDLKDSNAVPRPLVNLLFAEHVRSIEADSVWDQPVTGSADSPLAPLIERLSNIDWVQAGTKYVAEHTRECPFCQQRLPHNFREQLGQLLDGEFHKAVTKIELNIGSYEALVVDLNQSMQALFNMEPFANEHKSLKDRWERFHMGLARNLAHMRRKLSEPGKAVVMEDSTAMATAFQETLVEINARIQSFNDRIKNRQAEMTTLGREFWKTMRFENADVVDSHDQADEKYSEAKDKFKSIETSIEVTQRQLNAVLAKLRAESINTEVAVQGINKRLKSLGIDGFELSHQPGGRNLYCLKRPGKDIEEYKSLSEGEKTLISFFYFIELVEGSPNSEQNTPRRNKIVVIDDPISSLSHTHVYDIVDSIVDAIIKAEPHVRQVVVLTHSLFFYHEMVKQLRGAILKNQTQFFRVVKRRNSSVRVMEHDEIKSEYQSFWQVIKDARDGGERGASVANAMRCILEHFFSFTDQEEVFKDALKTLTDDDANFAPLARYLDRKSHSDMVNLTDFGDNDVGYYVERFEAVFEKTKYADHFKKMMA
jgi:wobble nucleotide-excising tRNase